MILTMGLVALAVAGIVVIALSASDTKCADECVETSCLSTNGNTYSCNCGRTCESKVPKNTVMLVVGIGMLVVGLAVLIAIYYIASWGCTCFGLCRR